MPVTFNYSVDQALSYLKDDVADDIRRAREQGARRRKLVNKNFKLLAKLATVLPQGCELTIDGVWKLFHPIVKVEREALPALRKAIGKLNIAGKSLHDAEKRLVSVDLTSEAYPGINFQYIRPLAENATCKIVEHTSTYKSLACEL